ncbi:MAG: hypothetical protein ACR2IE_05105 [Candidatus Sumerlaeaceae bacterium]
MSNRDEMNQAVREMLDEILAVYEERVPARSKFPDLRAGRRVHFGDPSITLPGRVELAVMHMDAEIDRQFDSLRFLAVRVWKSRNGGMASTTCFHATKDTLQDELERQLEDPSYIIDRVEELAHGLPEETNPDVWR